jgi:hypothetical protein
MSVGQSATTPEIPMSNIETNSNYETAKNSNGRIIRIFAARLATRRRVALSGALGSFDAENRFAVFHQVEPVAGDRFQINRVVLEQIDFASLLGEQCLLLIALGLELGNIVLADFQFLVGRHEQADDHEPDRKEEQRQEDTVPSLPNGSFTSRPEICVIHFQRILPP